MKIVGITGGIGAGKSIACEIFRIIGVPVYDADSRAKALMNENKKIKDEVIQLFGEQSYEQGIINRVHIGKRAFHHPELLKQLNQVVHPEVARDFESWQQTKTTKYVLKEAALLVETGSYKHLDHLIVVTAPEEIRIQRVLKRDPHRNQSDVKAIIDRQMSEEEKVKVADSIIHNDDYQLVIPQVLSVHRQLAQL